MTQKAVVATDDDDDVECCMTQAEINAKHIHLRGSLAYKYPPKESRCHSKCELGDMPVIDRNQNRKYADHGCFLTISHKGLCQFSSECHVGQVVNA